MGMDKELLKILVCPKCKGNVSLNAEGNAIVCGGCKLLFPIEDDIPVMLIDEAKRLD